MAIDAFQTAGGGGGYARSTFQPLFSQVLRLPCLSDQLFLTSNCVHISMGKSFYPIN